MIPAPTNDQLSDRPGEPQSTPTVPGWYECVHRSCAAPCVNWWNGTNLFLYQGWVKQITEHYTDFHGPLTVQPEGWEEVVEAAREHVAAVEQCGLGLLSRAELSIVHVRLRAALAKLDTQQERNGE